MKVQEIKNINSKATSSVYTSSEHKNTYNTNFTFEDSYQQPTLRKNSQTFNPFIRDNFYNSKDLQDRSFSKANQKQNMRLLNINDSKCKAKQKQLFEKDFNKSFAYNQSSDRSHEQSKVQELKNRFNKIKSTYNQTHKLIHNNITNCLQNLNQEPYCPKNQNQDLYFLQNTNQRPPIHTQVNQFSLTKEQIFPTFANQPCIDNIMIQSKTNPKLNVNIVQAEKNQKSINPSTWSNGSNQLELANKYRSLSKQLLTFRQNELIDILIEEIQTNQKNKHTISLQNNEKEQLRKEVQIKSDEILKLKKQIESKREQVQILLETEKKNLQIIDKLKKSLSNESKTQKTPQLQAEPIVVNDSPANNQKQIPRQSRTQVQEQEQIDYKLKHDELQKYMNEYINNIHEAHEEYKRNLSQFKETDSSLKTHNAALAQEKAILQDQIKQLTEDYLFKEKESNLISSELHKLTHALSNSKLFIKELEEEFLSLRQQNTELKSIISNLQKQLRERLTQMKELEESNFTALDKIDGLTQKCQLLESQNKNLESQNKNLTQDFNQINEKINSNTQIESEIKEMLLGLTQEKTNIQNQLFSSIQTIQLLKSKAQAQENKIYSHMQKQKEYLQKIQILHQNIKELQSSEFQLNNKMEILKKQNLILEETNSEMQKLQEELLEEYEKEKIEKEKLKSELLQIIKKVKQMQAIYVNQLSSNELIKKELKNFFQNQKESPHLHSQSPQLCQKLTQLASNCCQHNFLSNEESSNEEISFKRSSKITKEGSSSVFKQHLNSDEIQNQSLVQQRENIETESAIVSGSLISNKYFSESDSETNLELGILQNSKKVNVNLMNQGVQKSRKKEL